MFKSLQLNAMLRLLPTQFGFLRSSKIPAVTQLKDSVEFQNPQRSLTSLTSNINNLLPMTSTLYSMVSRTTESGLLKFFIPSRGMKIKARVRRRCKDCSFMYKGGILYNVCKTYGRHKQMLKPQYFTNTRIMTAVSTVIRKPW